MPDTESAFPELDRAENRAGISDALATAFEHHTGKSSSGDAGAPKPPREVPSDPEQDEVAGSAARPKSDHAGPEKPAPQTVKAGKAAPQTEPAAKDSTSSWADKNSDIFGRLPVEGQRY